MFLIKWIAPWMPRPNGDDERRRPWHAVPQRRVSTVDHLRPQRWNWSLLVAPLDRRVERQAEQPLSRAQIVGLRFFWLDGFFSAVSENFYLGYIPLLALAFGATNGQVGWIAAVGNLLGALALFPGARAAERRLRRKPIVLWTGAGLARIMVLLLAMTPFVLTQPTAAIVAIVVLNGVRAFMANFANPAWTAMVADLVPEFMRGRYFSGRNLAMGAAALVVAPMAGWLIQHMNGMGGWPHLGYQTVFFLAFCFGALGALNFARIPEPEVAAAQRQPHQRGDLRRALRTHREFVGLVVSAFVWNLGIQVAGPFFNVYLVQGLGGTAATVGVMASISAGMSLVGQMVFGRWLDRRGAIWVQVVSGFTIVLLPLGWTVITAPWHAYFIGVLGGFAWAGYNLANFNLLLELTPDEQRPRAVALFQFVVFASAFVGPLLGGYMADVLGYRSIFAASGAGRFLAMVLFVFLAAIPARRNGRGLPKAPQPQ